MITLSQYVGIWAGSKDWTPECTRNAVILLSRVNLLLRDYEQVTGNVIAINPKTKSEVSGELLGGFRPQSTPIGATKSAHKTGEAVDVYDITNHLDWWIDTNAQILVKYDLYRESPVATMGWCHLSTRAPKSKSRTFIP